MRTAKPSLLLLLVGAAGLSMVAHAADLAAPAPPAAQPPTRMGVSIQQSVSDRDKAAAARNRALDLREQAARAAEQRMAASLRNRPADQPAAETAASDERDPYDGLARIYQTMKPAKAARVFEQLDIDVQVAVAQRMRDRSTAMLLASMTPETAAKLSMAMAQKEPEKTKTIAAERQAKAD